MQIDPNLIFINLEVETKEEALGILGSQLHISGYVKEKFPESVLEREEKFPTGLHFVPYGVAIPHTDGDKVIQSQLAFASLKKPVPFMEMGNVYKNVEVSLIFMLALTTPKDQPILLQKLMEMLQDKVTMNKLVLLEETGKIMAILQEQLDYK